MARVTLVVRMTEFSNVSTRALGVLGVTLIRGVATPRVNTVIRDS